MKTSIEYFWKILELTDENFSDCVQLMLTISSAYFTYEPDIVLGMCSGLPVAIDSNAGKKNMFY